MKHDESAYLKNIDLNKFQDDTLLQDGIIRQIEIMGEATKRLSSKLKEKYNHVPWLDIAGMRDKLIHDYFGVDIGKVWLTTKEDLPILRKKIEKILREIS